MATKYGLSIAGTFVRGNAGSTIESVKKKYDKDKLASVACSLGWLVQNTLGADTFKTCLNLVESSPSCGGGGEWTGSNRCTRRAGWAPTKRARSTLPLYALLLYPHPSKERRKKEKRRRKC